MKGIEGGGVFRRVLAHDIAVILAFLFLFMLGALSLASMNVEFLPRRREPVLTVITECRGMEPRVVEKVVTKPIESLLKESEGVASFRSFSRSGRSKILVFLERGEDIDRRAVLIKDVLAPVADALPAEVREPAVFTYDTDDSPVMIVSLTPAEPGDAGVPALLGTLADGRVKPELLAIEGIANVETAGKGREDYFIELDREGAASLGAGYERVFSRIVEGNLSVPLGNLESEHELMPVGFPNKYRSLPALRRHPIRLGSRLVPGGALLSVVRRDEEESMSLVDNRPSLALYLYRKDGANLLRIEREVQSVLKEWEGSFASRAVYSQAEALRSLLVQLRAGALAAGACLFGLVLLLYRKVSIAWPVLLTVPVCMGCTVALIALSGRSLNVMTLAGVVAGMGACPGGALTVFERLGSLGRGSGGRAVPAAGAEGDTRGDTVRALLAAAADKSSVPVCASALAMLAVFVPLFFVENRAMSLYSDFALSVSAMTVVSSAVSLLFFPAMVSRFLPGRLDAWTGTGEAGRTSGVLSRRAAALLEGAARGVIGRPVPSLVLYFSLSGFSAFYFLSRDVRDVPPLRERGLEVFYEFEPEYSFDYKERAVKALGREILESGPPVELVTKLEGDRADFFLKFPNGRSRAGRSARILEERFSSADRADGFFHCERGSDAGTDSLVVDFFGDDLERLSGIVDAAAFEVLGLPGVRQALKGFKRGKPEIVLDLDQARVYREGLSPDEIVRYLRYVLHFPVIMKHYEGGDLLDVRGKVGFGGLDKAALPDVHVPNSRGSLVALSELGSIGFGEGPGVISRVNGKRCIPLEIRFEGAGENEIAERVRACVERGSLPRDFYCEFGGEFPERRESSLSFLFAFGSAVFLVYTAVGIVTKSFGAPLVAILGLPAMFVGSSAYLWASGSPRSAASNVAVMMLAGLSVSTFILLLGDIGKRAGEGGKAIAESYRKLGRVLAFTTLSNALPLVPVYLCASGTDFFRVVTGTASVGWIVGMPLALWVFPALCPAGRARGSGSGNG